jgi:hypothetical protein
VTTYTLFPPVVAEGPVADGPLFSRYKLYRGISILKNLDGSYSQVRYPSLDELNASAAYYLGGHSYTLTPQEVTDLTAAGYGPNIVTS